MIENKNTITAIIIIYNEEKLIGRCLSSIKDVVDKIMVFHDGECKDESLEIAKKYTDDIFVLEHKGHIEAHLVMALSMAQTEWVLILDADEYLSDNLKKNLRELIKPQEIDAYSFLEPIYIPEKEKYTYDVAPRRKVSLLRLNKMYYIGIIHQGCSSYGKVINTDYILEHKPLIFNFTFKSYQKKWLKLAEIHAESYFKKWKEISKFNYNGADVRITPKEKFKFNYPLFAIVPIFLSNFFKLFKLGKSYKKFTYTFSFLLSLYAASVSYYVFKFKIRGQK